MLFRLIMLKFLFIRIFLLVIRLFCHSILLLNNSTSKIGFISLLKLKFEEFNPQIGQKPSVIIAPHFLQISILSSYQFIKIKKYIFLFYKIIMYNSTINIFIEFNNKTIINNKFIS